MSETDLAGLVWRKSRHSAINGNCVEVAHLPGQGRGIRDSKDRSGSVLIFSDVEWAAFVNRVKDGEFDL